MALAHVLITVKWRDTNYPSTKKQASNICISASTNIWWRIFIQFTHLKFKMQIPPRFRIAFTARWNIKTWMPTRWPVKTSESYHQNDLFCDKPLRFSTHLKPAKNLHLLLVKRNETHFESVAKTYIVMSTSTHHYEYKKHLMCIHYISSVWMLLLPTWLPIRIIPSGALSSHYAVEKNIYPHPTHFHLKKINIVQ